MDLLIPAGLIALVLLFSQIDGQMRSGDSTHLMQGEASESDDHHSDRHEYGINRGDRRISKRQSETDFERLVDELAYSIGKDDRMQMKCNEDTQTCSFLLDEDDHNEDLELNAPEMASIAEMIEDDEDEGRGLLTMTYNNSKLGSIKGDEPLMHVKTLPASDAKIGTKFTLEVSKGCARRRRRRSKKICREKLPIHYNTIHDATLPECDVLTATIHGFISQPLHVINKPLAAFHAEHYTSACILIVDWSIGALGSLPFGYSQASKAQEN